MMEFFQLLWLALLTVVSAVHLVHSWRGDEKKRVYTKPLLLILLIAYYVASTKALSTTLILALATSWLGDVLLIPKGHGWFSAGGVSFMFTHFFLVVVYSEEIDFQLISWPLVAPIAVLYYGISAVVIYELKPTTPKIMLIPMYFYLICNSTMNIFSLMLFISLQSTASFVALVGAILFFISDCSLFLVEYYRNKNLLPKPRFVVMSTYIIGEFLITQGVLMLE